MSSKIKGILACTAAVIIGFYIWGLVAMGTTDLVASIMVGGVSGLLSGIAITVFAKANRPLAVGAGTMVFLYAVVAAVLIQSFGVNGLDIMRVLITGALMAGIGVAGGASYKFATGPAAPRNIGD